MVNNSCEITQKDGLLSVQFKQFDADAYRLFLQCKRLPEYQVELDADGLAVGINTSSRFAQVLGVKHAPHETGWLPFPSFLFRHQTEMLKLALDAQRYAVWSDCGTGKTLIELEFARQVAHRTSGRVLIFTQNEIVEQVIEEAQRFYGAALPVVRLESRAEMRDWCKNGSGFIAPPANTDDERIIDRVLSIVAGQHILRKLKDGHTWKDAAGMCGGTSPEMWEATAKGIKVAGDCERLISIKQINARVAQYTPAQVAITNYEKMNPDEQGQVVSELRYLSGLILDESSRLKGGGGKQKWALIHSSKGIPYKLSCTATPAPNDVIEFASQASFLERMRSENEIIWTFFARDAETQEWTVKQNARQAFFEWMSAWSIYLRDPRKYGWASEYAPAPQPVVITHEVAPTSAQLLASVQFNVAGDGQQSLFADKAQGIVGRSKLSQIAKGFLYQGKKARTVTRIESAKPEVVAGLVQQDHEMGLQVLVWTVFDEEVAIIAEALRDRSFTNFSTLSGSTPKAKRLPIIQQFRRGEIGVLISNADLLGYGMNFQNCGSMVFSGWDDSFESFYQACARAVRHGQTRAVRIHLPVIRELEGAQLDNLLRKAQQFEALVTEQEAAYIAAMTRLQILEVK